LFIFYSADKSEFAQYIAQQDLGHLGVATWLRVVIPDAIDALILDGLMPVVDYVLYADIDVAFLQDVVLPATQLPRYLSFAVQGDYLCCADTPKQRLVHINAGVMLMNVTGYRESYDGFVSYIRHTSTALKYNAIERVKFSDQRALQDYYPQKSPYVATLTDLYLKFFPKKYWSDRLPKRFEWEPYLGASAEAVILHWHGPKVSITDCSYKNILQSNSIQQSRALLFNMTTPKTSKLLNLLPAVSESGYHAAIDTYIRFYLLVCS
jgi:hypothetical protein